MMRVWSVPRAHWSGGEVVLVTARWLLGGLFLYMGWNKVLEPADFLVAIRQYHFIGNPFLLNLVAVVIPWIEILGGLMLVAGVGVRGCALLLLTMLLGFSLVVLVRALEIQQSTGLAFCAIRFDCGCGNGEVWICRKLVENAALLFLAAGVLSRREGRGCLRYRLGSPGGPVSS